jgi:hypothetical protein
MWFDWLAERLNGGETERITGVNTGELMGSGYEKNQTKPTIYGLFTELMCMDVH